MKVKCGIVWKCTNFPTVLSISNNTIPVVLHFWTLSKHPRINRRLTQTVLRGHKTMHSKKSAPIEPKYRLIRFKILILFPHNASGWYKNISPRSWINKKETCLPLQRASSQPAVEGGGARQPSQKPGCPHITWFMPGSFLSSHQKKVQCPENQLSSCYNTKANMRHSCHARH